MTADPYMDAIRAGAAALARPYTQAETVRAFVDEFPTLAAARVIEAALPHLRATILTEQAAPGPCPAVTDFGHEGIFANANDQPRQLRALCDLRAGHAGQHEANDEQWGHFRWTDQNQTSRCESQATIQQKRTARPDDMPPGTAFAVVPDMTFTCERTLGHPGWHIAGTNVWDGIGEIVLT